MAIPSLHLTLSLFDHQNWKELSQFSNNSLSGSASFKEIVVSFLMLS